MLALPLFAASVSDPHQFKSGRQFAAWLGLTPLLFSNCTQPRRLGLGP
nr:transposase [Sphingomonas sp. LH128]